MSTEEKKARLSRLLQEFQVQHDISARKLALRMKINPTSLGNYLDGVNYPAPETREKIALAMGLTPNELESYLDNVPLQRLQPLEQTLQDVKTMSDQDFQRVLEVVHSRTQDDLKRLLERVEQLGDLASDNPPS